MALSWGRVAEDRRKEREGRGRITKEEDKGRKGRENRVSRMNKIKPLSLFYPV